MPSTAHERPTNRSSYALARRYINALSLVSLLAHFLLKHASLPGSKAAAALALFLPRLSSALTHKKEGPLAHAANLTVMVTAVTGPSAACSAILLGAQFWGLSRLADEHPFAAAFLYRSVIRHAFFATNHACSVSALQYNAAFVVTEQFEFYTR
jgi:hypothetical protein